MLKASPSEFYKRRLNSVVTGILLTASALVMSISLLGFLATRSHMFHIAYSTRQQHLQNSEWLLKQCTAAEFYSNMKHHSTLCDDIALAHTDSLWLHALRDVIDQTHVCGENSCIEAVQTVVLWILDKGLMSLTLVSCCLVIVFVVGVHLHRWLWMQQVYMSPQQISSKARHVIYPQLLVDNAVDWSNRLK